MHISLSKMVCFPSPYERNKNAIIFINKENKFFKKGTVIFDKEKNTCNGLFMQ